MLFPYRKMKVRVYQSLNRNLYLHLTVGWIIHLKWLEVSSQKHDFFFSGKKKILLKLVYSHITSWPII